MSLGGTIGIGLAQAAVDTGLGMWAEERQLRNQKELMNRQQQNQMRLNEQGQRLAMQTWNETNYEAQRKHMEKAGLNVGLMYGMSGGGGATTNAGSGGGAAGGSAASHKSGMDIQSAMQLSLMDAQKKNIEADTKNKEAAASATHETGLGQWLKNTIQKMELDSPDENKVYRSKHYDTSLGLNQNSKMARMWNAEVNAKEQEVKNAMIQNDIMEAEKIIKEFDAELTKDGISPGSPWYVKLMTDLLNKTGIIDWLKP